jgi:uncharacterized NAD(P)/FAD-binding protein YdhS
MPAIAIIGLGPWGVCALERVITRTRAHGTGGRGLAVHVIEPRTPGAGVYDVDQPDYLLLNNPAGQLSLYTGPIDDSAPPYAIGLYDWAVAQGYRWVQERCVIDRRGRPLTGHDFLPRRIMGEYLHWFYNQLVRAAPQDVRVIHHPAEAVDIRARPAGEEVVLSDGARLEVDHVILTSGHTANREAVRHASMPEQLLPYPVSAYVQALPADWTVAVSGMGLVALDVVITLTVGRGGRFVGDGERLRYRPSGREPALQMFSRSGLPYTAKSVTGVDRTDFYEPAICTAQALARLRPHGAGSSEGIDVRAGLLPLLFAEMSVRYYAQLAFRQGSRAQAAAVRRRLAHAWHTGSFDAELSRLADRYGPFDAERTFFGESRRYADRHDYERSTYEQIAADLREAHVPDGASPLKCATEVWRIFRDPIRAVIEYRGPTLESYLDFHADIRSRINRLVAGPPALRSAQLLALIDAGVLSMPYGPAPALGPPESARRRRGSAAPATGGAAAGGGARRTAISSTRLRAPHADVVDVVIRGHLEEPRIDGSASTLLGRLYERGRISQLRYGSVAVGSIDLTPDAHPISLDGIPQERIWIFGVLTEGARHFTHYIPSPRSRIRAVQDIGACVQQILGSARARPRRAAAGRRAVSAGR